MFSEDVVTIIAFLILSKSSPRQLPHLLGEGPTQKVPNRQMQDPGHKGQRAGWQVEIKGIELLESRATKYMQRSHGQSTTKKSGGEKDTSQGQWKHTFNCLVDFRWNFIECLFCALSCHTTSSKPHNNAMKTLSSERLSYHPLVLLECYLTSLLSTKDDLNSKPSL